MKTVATLLPQDIAIIAQMLGKEGIASETRLNCTETGLDLTDLLVEDGNYERACDLIEAFEETHSQPEGNSASQSARAIDVSKLKPKIEEVRRLHLRTRTSARSIGFHRTLLEMFHGTVVRLPYFRDRNPEEHVHTDHT